MTAVGILCAVAGSWLVLAVLVAPRIGRFLARADQQPQPDDDTRWLPFLPPVPPVRSAHDTDWLADQPVEVLSDYEVDFRFWQLADGAEAGQ